MAFFMILVTCLPFLAAWLILQTLISGAPDGDAHNNSGSPTTCLKGKNVLLGDKEKRESKEKVERMNPIVYVNLNDSPFFMACGDAER